MVLCPPKLLITACCLLLVSVAEAEEKVDFNRDIRPILADRCFHCHGPAEKDRQAHLRLDRPDGEEGALRTLAGSTAIKPGDLDSSQLWYRITTDDENERMPPADVHKKPLSVDEQQLFKKWVLQGAEYDEFWAFVPPKRTARPEVKHEAWRNGFIDPYVMARLEQQERIEQEAINRMDIAHMYKAFHGRTGYTMSMTNTDRIKTKRFFILSKIIFKNMSTYQINIY